MKLTKFFFATMIACTFAACSNENDPIPGNNPETADASLSVAINSLKKTKATTDADINTLTIAIFNNGAYTDKTNGELIFIQDAENGNDYVENIKIKTGAVTVMAFANIPSASLQGLKTISQFVSKTIEFNDAARTNGTLPMSSDALNVTLIEGENYIGYCAASGQNQTPKTGAEKVGTKTDAGNELTAAKIKLYRNVARISFKKLSFNPATGYDNEAKFSVESIFIMNASKYSYIANNTATWGALVTDQDQYLTGVTTPSAPETTAIDAYFSNTTFNYTAAKEISGGTNLTDNLGDFYAFENDAADNTNGTMLVVKGTYSYKAANGETVKFESRYYPVVIGEDNVTEEGDITVDRRAGVMRNVEYRINLNITGTGYNDPREPQGNANFNAAVEVVPFGYVEQGAEVE